LKTSAWVCRIKHLCGRQWPSRAGAADNKNPAIGQARGGMIDAGSGERCAGGRSLRLRIKDFGNGDEVPGAVASTGDQNAAIGQRGRSMCCARNNKGIELRDLSGT